MPHSTTRDVILGYLKAIESRDRDAVSQALHPDIQLVEHPNKISPSGMRADLAGIQAASERGAKLMASERYDVRSMIVDGDRAAVQLVWSGTLAIAAGALPAGHVMRAQICSIFELRDGRIYRQEQYDCFES